jgi:hypothetical protein
MTYNQWLRGLSGKDDSKITIKQEARSMWIVYREYLVPDTMSRVICACRNYEQAQRIAKRFHGRKVQVR